MKKFALTWASWTALAVGMLGMARASGPGAPPGACEPGYKWVQVTEQREVCRQVCKMVPDVKETKKWVYSMIDDPFCIKRSGHGCDENCATCEGPYCRKQLVKKLVVCKEPSTKCVVEKIVEQVPCTVWRKVPCDGPGASVQGAPAAATSEKKR